MTKDQKALLIFQLDNIIDLGEDITPEKRTELMGKLRNYVDDLQTGKRKSAEQTA